MKFVIIAVLIALAAIWLKSRYSPGDQRQSTGAKPKRKLEEKKISSTTAANNPYHAVSIRHEANACPSVLGMGKRRFLSGEVPIIPLPECNSTHCDCKYIHHKDRRSRDGERRSISQGRSSGRKERRTVLGRRENDRGNHVLT